MTATQPFGFLPDMNALDMRLTLDDETLAPPLEVLEIRGHEEIGQPYKFVVTVRVSTGEGTQKPVEEWIASTAKLELGWLTAGAKLGGSRTLFAVVERVSDRLDVASDNSRTFDITLRPRCFELSRFVTQDVYVGSTVPAVIRTKLGRAQFDAETFALRLADESIYTDQDNAPGDLSQGRLIIQYKESDLAFLSRLCEHLGISFFFEEGESAERLVFTDYDGGFSERSEALSFGGDGQSPGLLALRREVGSVPSTFYAYDYNYRTPQLDYQKDGHVFFDVLGGEADLDVPSAGAELAYAPNAKTPNEAARLARIRADQQEAVRERYIGSSSDPTLFPGQRLTISNHVGVDDTQQLLVVKVEHAFIRSSSFQGEAKSPPAYALTFEAVRVGKTNPKGEVIQFRPAAITPRPRISGVVTGIIQSPSAGQQLGYHHLDTEGRYIVKFHFDQGLVQMPRMRMAQPHAGPGYGQHFPLRPGAEVLIAFLDGDPDRPVIVGALANPVQRSPVTRALDTEPVDVHRIRTLSGVMIEISDGNRRS